MKLLPRKVSQVRVDVCKCSDIYRQKNILSNNSTPLAIFLNILSKVEVCISVCCVCVCVCTTHSCCIFTFYHNVCWRCCLSVYLLRKGESSVERRDLLWGRCVRGLFFDFWVSKNFLKIFVSFRRSNILSEFKEVLCLIYTVLYYNKCSFHHRTVFEFVDQLLLRKIRNSITQL